MIHQSNCYQWRLNVMDNCDNFQRNSSDYSHLDIQHFNPKAFIRLVKISDIREKLMSGGWWDLIHYARCDVSFLSIEQWVWFWDGRIRNKKNNKGVLAPWDEYASRVDHNSLLLILSTHLSKETGCRFFTTICSCCPEICVEYRSRADSLTSHLKFRAGLCDWRSQRHTA